MNQLLSSINENSSSDFREIQTHYLALINENEVKILENLPSTHVNRISYIAFSLDSEFHFQVSCVCIHQ